MLCRNVPALDEGCVRTSTGATQVVCGSAPGSAPRNRGMFSTMSAGRLCYGFSWCPGPSRFLELYADARFATAPNIITNYTTDYLQFTGRPRCTGQAIYARRYLRSFTTDGGLRSLRSPSCRGARGFSGTIGNNRLRSVPARFKFLNKPQVTL